MKEIPTVTTKAHGLYLSVYSIVVGFGELGTWRFPYTGDYDAYCLIKTQLHGSKTFLRRRVENRERITLIRYKVLYL